MLQSPPGGRESIPLSLGVHSASALVLLGALVADFGPLDCLVALLKDLITLLVATAEDAPKPVKNKRRIVPKAVAARMIVLRLLKLKKLFVCLDELCSSALLLKGSSARSSPSPPSASVSSYWYEGKVWTIISISVLGGVLSASALGLKVVMIVEE